MLFLLIVIFFNILFWWYYTDWKRYANYPPGPLRHPIIGNLLQIAASSKIPPVGLYKLSKNYGNVMHVRMGSMDMVVVNGHSAVMEISNSQNMDTIAHLDFVEHRNGKNNLGIVLSNGNEWHTMRLFTMRTLKDFGFGKSSMKSVILEEAQKVVEHIKSLSTGQNKSSIVENAVTLFDLPSLNVLWRLVTGNSFQMCDAKINELLQLNREYFKTARMDDITMAYPQLHKWFPNWSGKNKQIYLIGNIKKFINKIIEESEKEMGENPNNFIECFLSKMDNQYFTRTQLTYVLLDLFQTGSEVTSNTLAFALLYMILYPEVQRNVQQELDSVDLESTDDIDKSKLPYTHATILECMRFCSVVPMSILRESVNDFLFQGYTIKKGTAVMINLHSAHFDEKVWDKPDSFCPTRFLKNGVISKAMADKVVAFGKGKRDCLGKSLAEHTVFVFFATIFKQLKLEIIPGDKVPSDEPTLGPTFSPQPFRCLFVDRKTD